MQDASKSSMVSMVKEMTDERKNMDGHTGLFPHV